MGSNTTNALLSLIMALDRCGEINLSEFKEILNSLNQNIFICGKSRIRRKDFAKKLENHPILIECNRGRVHKLVTDLEEMMGKPIHKEIVCRKGSFRGTIYIIYTEDQKDRVREIIDNELGTKCGGN